jgi:micrococcal nuclease
MLKEILLATVLSLQIIDGDTIKVDGLTYRLVGYDTPELRSGKCVAERRLASKARLRLSQLASEPSAKLQEVLCHGSNFGRKCGIVYVNGKNIATVMVKEGFADNYWCGSAGCPKRRNWCEGKS